MKRAITRTSLLSFSLGFGRMGGSCLGVIHGIPMPFGSVRLSYSRLVSHRAGNTGNGL